MSLAPSRCTVYVSNLPYDLKNNDLHKLFEKHGKIIKVTVLKDKNRKSKGVAFILFLKREDAQKCIAATNEIEMFGRVLKASLAKDNGRSAEFIRKRTYPDKTTCYECGETGHLSYNCTKNLLGNREPPPKKVRKRKKKNKIEDEDNVDVSDNDQNDSDYEDCETLSAAIALEQEKCELECYKSGNYSHDNQSDSKKKKFRRSSYFSDEEEIE